MVDNIASIGTSRITGLKPTQDNHDSFDAGQQFNDILKNAIGKLAADEQQVEQLNDLFMSGEMTSIEQLLIASQKASLQLELTVQFRNKVIEAYQEIMRTQI